MTRDSRVMQARASSLDRHARCEAARNGTHAWPGEEIGIIPFLGAPFGGPGLWVSIAPCALRFMTRRV